MYKGWKGYWPLEKMTHANITGWSVVHHCWYRIIWLLIWLISTMTSWEYTIVFLEIWSVDVSHSHTRTNGAAQSRLIKWGVRKSPPDQKVHTTNMSNLSLCQVGLHWMICQESQRHRGSYGTHHWAGHLRQGLGLSVWSIWCHAGTPNHTVTTQDLFLLKKWFYKSIGFHNYLFSISQFLNTMIIFVIVHNYFFH